MLVLHYTGMTTAAAALERLCDPDARVSAHYVVEENGVIWRLVPESRRAFHAGVSCWEGESDLNAVSLGIEIVNPGHEWGYRPFPEAQMASVEALCRDLICTPFDPAAPSCRALGYRARPQERSRRAVRLAEACPRRDRDLAAGEPRPAGVRDRPCRSRSPISRLSAIARQAVAGPGRRWPSNAASDQDCCDGRLDPETAARLSEVRAAFARSRAADQAGRCPAHTLRAQSLPQCYANKSRCPSTRDSASAATNSVMAIIVVVHARTSAEKSRVGHFRAYLDLDRCRAARERAFSPPFPWLRLCEPDHRFEKVKLDLTRADCLGRRLLRSRRCGSIQPGGPVPFGLAPDDLAGLVVGDPPHAVFADKEVARGERAAVELLLAQHQRHVAIKECLLVKTGDARRVGVRQGSRPSSR